METDESGASLKEDAPGDADAVPIPADLARAFLAERGIELGAGDSNAVVALMVATWEGDCDALENLIAAGAPVNGVNMRPPGIMRWCLRPAGAMPAPSGRSCARRV